MSEGTQRAGERALLRIGAVSAVLGTILSVAAGVGYGGRPAEAGAQAALRYVASLPVWYWPAVHLGFIIGALLWVAALVALATALTHGASWALGRLGAASVITGATIHVIDSALDGVGITALAHTQAPIAAAQVLLAAVDGLWASVIGFFHGLPFILYGLAVALSLGSAAWLGWFGAAAGAGSFVIGILMFLGVAVPQSLFVVFALAVSMWMLVIGFFLWRRPAAVTGADLPPTPGARVTPRTRV